MFRSAAAVALLVLLSAPAFAQSAATPRFETADVHTAPPNAFGGMADGVLRGNRYEVRGATMVDLIKNAYGVDAEKVLGGPSWLELDRFDVIANAPAGVTPDSAKAMLQALLADRFSLAVHNDTRPTPVFVLTAGKGNPKMKPASGSGATGCQGQPGPPPAPGAIPTNVVTCHEMTMALFADQVHQMANGYLDHVVIDQTKLAGSWDFDLLWTPRGALAAAGSDGVSIFDAVDKQLGLKLEPQTMPSAVVVVDKVNQKPTANLPGVGAAVSDAPVEFEAAEIKPSAPNSSGAIVTPSGAPAFRFQYMPGGRVSGEGALRDYIAFSLNIPPNLSADLLVGTPKFVESRYEIIAKTPSAGIGAPTHVNGQEAPPPLSVALLMLHQLLVERFKLTTHVEEQPVTAYTLTVPRGATPKLKKADAMERASCKPAPDAAPPSANATPVVAYRCLNTSMAELAQNVAGWAGAYFDHPAFDATGLTGGYDFVLSWTPKGALHPVQAAGAPAGAASDPGGQSVFEALEKELGLKVETQKHAIAVTVIDHVEEKPTDN